MDNGSAAHEELRQYLRERDQQAFQAVVEFHGGLEGWFDLCRRRRAANPDHKLAAIIVRILRRGSTASSAFRLMTNERRQLEGEPALMEFWNSVANAGDDGWQEERRRVQDVQRAASRATSTEGRKLALDVFAVQSLVPLYRAWGQMLLEAASDAEHHA